MSRENRGRTEVFFVGYTDIDAEEKNELVKQHGDKDNDWLTKKSDDHIKDHIDNMIAYSKRIKSGCEKHGLPYFDTSDDFLAAIDAATDFLVGDQVN